MRIRFLLGPAGSGKTYRCLAEIRRALSRQPDGPPLILLAPKQATFQLERQILSTPGLAGYARLQIVSFDRLAAFVLEQLGHSDPPLLAEEGRVMVLRSLLAREETQLRVFQSSARMPGFARQLSELLREFQRHQVGPTRLRSLANSLANSRETPRVLANKLHDSAHLLEGYTSWLETHGLQDADRLLDIAADALMDRPVDPNNPLISELWLDGFAEMTPQEMHLLEAVTRQTSESTLAYCLDQAPAEQAAWFSAWGTISETFRKCHVRLSAIPGVQCHIELLTRNPDSDRFGANSVLRHIETHFARPRPAAWGKALDSGGSDSPRKPWDTPEFDFETPDWRHSLQVYSCPGIEAEALAAAREIWRHVRAGGRFREIAVLCRTLDTAAPIYRRVFRRHHIPCFIDQRAPVTHHPLAEFTRAVLRTLAFGWRPEDWFAVMKSGLVGLDDWNADRLENEALANGWGPTFWHSGSPPAPTPSLEQLRIHLVQPVLALRDRLGSSPDGVTLAGGLRELWRAFRVDEVLCSWDSEELDTAQPGNDSGTRHATIGRQLDQWLGEVARAFRTECLPLTQWIPVLESALGGLTVGLVPPSLDQVLLGAIDRSRNPDLRLVLLPGWNDGVFPARPGLPTLLSETDRDHLALAGMGLGPLPLARLGHERFYAYIALTRARERVVITYSTVDAQGTSLTPSPFLSHLRKLFPELQPTPFVEAETLRNLPPLRQGTSRDPASLLEPPGMEQLEPGIARVLYGNPLRSSVSRLEQFASCPFQHFVASGLRLGERKRFELDARERGSFQHEVLARFHVSLTQDGPGWRAITESEARARVRTISEQVATEFRRGLSLHTGVNRFASRHLTLQLEGLVAELLRWLPHYGFNPEWVELAFGSRNAPLPAWTLDLGQDRQLQLEGKMDRVDLTPAHPGEIQTALVFDYKSSKQTLNPLLLENGIQMQLPVYLTALQWLGLPNGSSTRPGGIAYLSLKATTKRVRNRTESKDNPLDEAPFRHEIRGRFDLDVHSLLQPPAGPPASTPFKVRLKKDGQPYKTSDLMPSAEFADQLRRIPRLLTDLGRRILEGEAKVAPYQAPNADTPCEQCRFMEVCRIQPESFHFRTLESPSPN